MVWLLLATIAMCGGLAAIIAPEWRAARGRREAVDAVTALGGTALYNWQLEDKMGPSEPKDFVREIFGDPALFAYVSHVELTGSRFAGEDLVLLESFAKAQWIIIGDSQVTDDAMDSLSRRVPQYRIRR